MARVILSYASADKPVVRRIAEALRAAGHEPWFDEEDILIGESIPAAVGHGLREADFVVVCLSKATMERGWVATERDATLTRQLRERKSRILPVRLEDVAPPYLLASLACVDMFPDEQAFKLGIARLASLILMLEARLAGLAGGYVANSPGSDNARAVAAKRGARQPRIATPPALPSHPS